MYFVFQLDIFHRCSKGCLCSYTIYCFSTGHFFTHVTRNVYVYVLLFNVFLLHFKSFYTTLSVLLFVNMLYVQLTEYFMISIRPISKFITFLFSLLSSNLRQRLIVKCLSSSPGGTDDKAGNKAASVTQLYVAKRKQGCLAKKTNF